MSNNVTVKHPQYGKMLDKWCMLEDVCSSGDESIKNARTKYLPMPNPHDESPENAQRYEQYLKRAVFYNVTGRTLRGAVGLVFRKWPNPVLPETLTYMLTDADGAGVSLYQQSQQIVDSTMKLARHGLFADYPKTGGEVSVADRKNNQIRARIVSVSAKDIINWRVEKIGGRAQLSLVVIKESVEEPNGFGVENKVQYRVLSLDAGVYRVRVYKDEAPEVAVEDYYPTDGSGSKWDVIPFTFIGATNNDASVDELPLLDLAVLNLAHYRNSADYEDSAFFVGQAQPWIGGLDEEWRDHLESTGLYIGSRNPILLPQGGSFGFAQAQPNTLIKEAMDTKEKQMVALGAHLIERGSAVKTATQVDSEDSTAHSVLSLIANNVSDAYTQVLKWCARYENVNDADIEFKLNQEFTEKTLSPQMLTALVASWQQGGMPQSQLFRNLKRFDVIDPELDNEAIKDELQEAEPNLDLDSEDKDQE